MSKYTNDFIWRQLRLLFNEHASCRLFGHNSMDKITPRWFLGNTYIELHSKDSDIKFAGDLLNITYADLQENYFEDILHPTQLELDFFKLQLGHDWPFTKEMKEDD